MPFRYADHYTWDEVGEIYYNDISYMIGERKKDKKEWVAWWAKQKVKSGGKTFFGKKTYAYCFNVYRKLRRNTDHFTVVVGKEGRGKSTLAAQLAVTVSDTFGKGSILFEPEDYLKKVEDAKIGDSIIADEGALFLMSRNAMRKTNVDMIVTMQLMRQQCVHSIICIPRWEDLDKYVRTHRADTLFYKKDVANYRAIMGNDSGISILNKIYPLKKNRITDVKLPTHCFFDEKNIKMFPDYNGINEGWYKEAKRKNYLDRSRRVRSELSGGST